MHIENINEKIRDFFVTKYPELEDSDIFVVDGFLEYMQSLRNSNYNFYKSILEAFYPIFYISNLERIGEVESLKKIEPDYDAEDEFVYDVDFLKSITTLDELIYEIENDPYLLVDMLNSNLTFNNKSELEKRGLLVEYKVCDEYLKKISKTWVFDRMDYCRKYTKEEFFSRCLTIRNSATDKDKSTSVMIVNSIDYLKELAIFDIDTFIDLFDLILQDTHVYLKYQLLFSEENIKLMQVIDRLENIYQHTEENILNDEAFMKVTISSFFMYNSCNNEEKEKMKTTLEKKKMLLNKKDKK